MNCIDQQVMHDPSSGSYGDCMRACIATLFNLTTDDVPHFYEDGDSNRFDELLREFIKDKGFVLVSSTKDDIDTAHFLQKQDIYHLIYGRTVRNTYHAVVGKNGEIFHDPHPSRDGLIDDKRREYVLLVKAYPASFLGGE